MTTVLVGDSHLARIRRDLHLFGEDVFNLAVGGATIVDVPRQVAHGVAGRGTFVVSIGTNDAHAERGIALEHFATRFAELVASLPHRRVLYLAPPGVIESRLPPDAAWTNARVDHYRAVALAECDRAEIAVVRADELLRPAGAKAFARDGLHLSGTGYELLLEALHAALSRARR